MASAWFLPGEFVYPFAMTLPSRTNTHPTGELGTQPGRAFCEVALERQEQCALAPASWQALSTRAIKSSTAYFCASFIGA
jgi:hypothetical protein